ncbi:putative baseplate assembly protein [Pseudomonas fluorescens]|uniref:Putative baseplate assembly protein n=1 Tax=Pseudomonas fluorescens TaxID=294 RepID=A0A0P8XHB0_PSEFL|nr:putative baseplate assembly protein [Pseudomonas fluorescens]KPU55474.1 putative baseplate assembly protein [Pseudomonas fluorescens]
MNNGEQCGCCAGIKVLTPVDELNPPGQTTLHYRVGTHGRFRESQLARLSGQPPLLGLSTRDADDPALALLDAWAGVLDVLSFYQERIANEGFLRTATERRSVLELGRAIGYELRPGVAASTFLAFSLETARGAPLTARIDAGTKSQSIPEQDEQAQVFETLEPLYARAAWNALRLKIEEELPPYWGARTLYLKGQNTRLQAGDSLLIVGDERLKNPGSENWDLRRVARLQVISPVEPSADPLAGYTVVTLDRPLGKVMPHVEPAKANPRCFALRTKAALFGQAAPDWRAMPLSLRASYLGLDDDNQAKISLHGQWPGFTLADISDPPTRQATGSGLYGEYFEGIDFKTRKLSRTDATVDFDWGSASPDPTLSVDTFSVRWSGWLQIPESGNYSFFVKADDGVRLWLGGQLLVNEWRDQGATEFSATLFELQAGQKLDLRLEYFENGGAATIQLRWQGPGIPKQIIPQSRLYPRDVHSVHLDASYPRLVTGSWLVLALPDYQELYQVLDSREDARAAFTLNSKTTRLSLRGEQLRELFNERLRETTAYGESIELPWATRPMSGLLSGHVLTLEDLQPELEAGRWLSVSGHTLLDVAQNAPARQRLLANDPLVAVEIVRDGRSASLSFTDGTRLEVLLGFASEVHRLQHNDSSGARSRLELESDLQHAYLLASVRINANVALASHGDSKQMQIQAEILGSGDASQAFQRFLLMQKPLTYISSPSPSGTQSTLQVRIDGVRWSEVSRLEELRAQDRAYLLRRSDDGRGTVQFGDGLHGSRLPSGQMNVQVSYRVGIGSTGNLDSGRISLLLSRPLGVKEVINPVPAAGGVDPESSDSARQNAPLSVRTMDRIVSLRDFEDFAAAFAGVGKAQAVWLWDGEQRLVHLTVSGVDGVSIDPGSALYRNLAAAIDAVRPAHQPLKLAPGVVLRFGVTAKVRVSPDYQSAAVLSTVCSALGQAFGFAARYYGQPVSGSEVLAVMQRVPGVERVDLDNLRLYDGLSSSSVAGPDGRLRARGARWQSQQILAAQLLLLDPAAVTLTELSL